MSSREFNAVCRPAPPWRPRRRPTARELLADNLRRRAGRVRRAMSALVHPATTARRVRALWPPVRELLGSRPEPPTSLNRVIGNDRVLVLVRGRLDEVRQIAHRHRATVNDVLLAVTAGGLRALLASRGEPVDRTVRVDLPVTLRGVAEREDARGNLVGQMVVSLPVGIADPGRRLTAIAGSTAAGKATSHPSVGVVLRSRIARRAMLRLLDRRPVNVTTADLVGPSRPMYLAGARVLEVYPLLPLMANVALGVGALSYGGQFNIAVIADRATHPRLDVFAAAVRAELATLGDTIGTDAPVVGSASPEPVRA